MRSQKDEEINVSFILSESQIKKIRDHFGDSFYEKIVKDIRVYAERWELEILEFVEYYSANCIFICDSKRFGDAVLKISNPGSCFTEVSFLKEYNGKGFCTLFDADIENGVILEEYIKPGTRLRDEKLLEKRLAVFSDLFNGLHIEPQRTEIYPTYFEWVSRITKYMSKRDDYKELYIYMKKAEDICASLCSEYSKKMLLHGDFHHDNILLGKNNRYKIIDPKGVIGDPIFDIPRFILNEFYDDEKISYEYYSSHMKKVTEFLSKSLSVPADVIKKCVFIETAMANCWMVEDEQAPDIDIVEYAEVFMNA